MDKLRAFWNNSGNVRMIELSLPYPPSANRLWTRTRRGMRRTDSYNNWLHTAGWALQSQRPGKIRGAYNIFITAVKPDKRKRDLGNLLKSTEDLLVAQGVVQDDCHAQLIVMRWTQMGEGISVRIEKA